VQGGRSRGLDILKNIGKFKNYNKERNNPAIPTTGLSAYMHFTPLSPREIYHAVLSELGIENNIVN
jgi:deoxyribodipyrimidine photo-lyase